MTNDNNPNITICTKIAELRRASGMTQDTLAEKLGVTYQAVSKWENTISCPDISLIPMIAEIFGVSIDFLFGKDIEIHEEKPKQPSDLNLPWEDDGKLYAVLFRGTKLLETREYKNEKMKITVELCGDLRDVKSEFNVSCQTVTGNVNAGEINCDTIDGNANAGSITCDTIGGNVQTGALTCDTIEGDVKSAAVTCDTIEGDVTINGGGLTCNGEIAGDLNAESCKITVNGDVSGDIDIRGGENALSVEGDVAGDLTLTGCSIEIEGDVAGDIQANGNNASIAVEGDMSGNIDICGAKCTVCIEGDMNGDIDVNAEDATVTVEGDMTS